jgi:nucleotide-binding universal stress UspA family protein
MADELKTILFCADFSPEAEQALEQALRLARATNAKLIVAHLVHVSSGELQAHDPEGPVNLTLPQARERALKRLEELRAQRLADYANVELLVDFGAPAQSLMDIAKARGADIIVAATHGRTELADLLRGSVTEALSRHAPCPVLVVPPTAS